MMSLPGRWNDRRLLIFTEWEDTRLWLDKRLKEVFEDTDYGEERIATFTGITGQDRREQVKFAFNADPAKEPLRVLLCTDAAREGVNLQTRCYDLIHFDLPWNPSRLEQRNGRVLGDTIHKRLASTGITRRSGASTCPAILIVDPVNPGSCHRLDRGLVCISDERAGEKEDREEF